MKLLIVLLSSFILLLLLSTLSETLVASTIAISFADLPRLVKERNENVQAAQSSRKAQEKRTGSFARSLLPKISATAGREQFKPGSEAMKSQEYWKVEASLNLYRGGRDWQESQARNATADIYKIEAAREYQQELKEARQTFWKLVATEKLLVDKEESLKRNEENLISSKRRSGAGIATAADTLQFELQRTTLNQELKKLILERDLLRNRLSVAIGMDEHESIAVSMEFPHPKESGSEVGNVVVNSQLDVAVLQAREKVERARYKQSSRWWHPKLDLYSNYGLPSLSDDFNRANRREKELTAGVRLGFDFGEGLEASSEAQARAFEAESLAKRTLHKTREVLALDHEFRHDLKILRELILEANRDAEKAGKFLRLTEAEYNRGVKNGPDLLGAFEKFYEFRQKRIELYRDYHETAAALDALVASGDILMH